MLQPMRTLAVVLSLSLGFAIQARDADAGGPGGAGIGMGGLAIGGYYPGICGATGTVTAVCPSYNKPAHAYPERPAQPYTYQSPAEECQKTGWGTPECPHYGAREEEAAEKPEYRPKPLDDCMKTGWGITECPNYGK